MLLAGPGNWQKTYPQCNGRRQSPIRLVHSESKYHNLTPFKFTGFDTVKTGALFAVENNGLIVHMTMKNITGASVEAFGKIVSVVGHP